VQISNHSGTNDLKNPNRTVALIHEDVDNLDRENQPLTTDLQKDCFRLEEITV
jgi:hypothetical protein